MAHSRYYFALAMEKPDATDDEIREEVKELTSSFFQDNCDGDNYHRKLYVVTKAGRAIPFYADEKDEDSLLVLWSDEKPPPTFEQTWDAATAEVALRILGWKVFEQFEALPHEERIGFLRKQGADRLSRTYTELASSELTPEHEYVLCDVAVFYRLFLESVTDCTIPFVRDYSDRTPYDYVAFYSRWVTEEGPNAILVADIHT